MVGTDSYTESSLCGGEVDCAGIVTSSGGFFNDAWAFAGEECGARLDAGIMTGFFGVCVGLSSTASRSISKTAFPDLVVNAPVRS